MHAWLAQHAWYSVPSNLGLLDLDGRSCASVSSSPCSSPEARPWRRSARVAAVSACTRPTRKGGTRGCQRQNSAKQAGHWLTGIGGSVTQANDAPIFVAVLNLKGRGSSGVVTMALQAGCLLQTVHPTDDHFDCARGDQKHACIR